MWTFRCCNGCEERHLGLAQRLGRCVAVPLTCRSLAPRNTHSVLTRSCRLYTRMYRQECFASRPRYHREMFPGEALTWQRSNTVIGGCAKRGSILKARHAFLGMLRFLSSHGGRCSLFTLQTGAALRSTRTLVPQGQAFRKEAQAVRSVTTSMTAKIPKHPLVPGKPDSFQVSILGMGTSPLGHAYGVSTCDAGVL